MAGIYTSSKHVIKSTHLTHRLILFLIITSCAMFGGVFFLRLSTSIQAGLPFEKVPTIILDPGHGGMDGGATANRVIEKDINLSIAIKLRDLFIINGYDVVMTRDTDISIHDPKLNTIKQQKTSDIHNRLEYTNKYPNSIFVSIHQNKFTQSQYSGAQIFYGINHPDSKPLAEMLQANIVKNLQPENKREIKKAYDSLYLMRKSAVPTVLVECGFLSNPTEASKLTDDNYQKEMAFVIFGTIATFLTGQK